VDPGALARVFAFQRLCPMVDGDAGCCKLIQIGISCESPNKYVILSEAKDLR
jgi:hypothetical protein